MAAGLVLGEHATSSPEPGDDVRERWVLMTATLAGGGHAGSDVGVAKYVVNPDAVARCRRLIEGRRTSSTAAGERSNPTLRRKCLPREALVERYAAWHLGLTDVADDETKARYAFVVGVLGRSRTALIACVYRASK